MGTIKSYTDLEQSKKLAEILPLESADMGYLWNGTSFCEYPVSNQTIFNRIENIPCWSFAALLNVLPEIQGGKPIIVLDDNYITYPHMSKLHTKADNLVDACVAMIIRLNELNLL